jgi:integrase/recombinase XerD
MKTLPVEDERHIGRFLKSMRFRDRKSATVYRCVLRGFRRFVREHEVGTDEVTEQTLRAWLQERHQQDCPLYVIVYRAQLIDRFLGWMRQCGHIVNNPFDELRGQYGRRIAPIVRALLSPDSATALEKLRPLPAFASAWGGQMREYVALMRSLGYRYITPEKILRRFDRFLQRRPDLTGQPLPSLIEAWRQAGQGAEHALAAQRCGRMLSKAQRRHDPTTAILPWDRCLVRQVRAEHRRPYIYTPEQIAILLATARALPSPRSPLRPLCVYTMFVLAYCMGLRLGEIVRLTLGDVNLHEGTLEIRETKFYKFRRLSLAPSVVQALRDYLEERRKAGAPPAATAALFWNQKTNKGYSSVTANALMVDVIRRAGLKPERGCVGPRVHDLRHSMVHSRMLSWYQQGVNPQSRLAYLATHLGHSEISSTLVYLTITPQLLELASERFRNHSAHVVRLEEVRS